MKKIMVAILACLLITTGCVDKKTDVKDDTNDGNNVQNVGKKNITGTLTYMDADITPGRSFNAKSIAAEATKSELPSCAFEGMDHVYRYDNIEITANVKDGKETIYLVYFIDETAVTNEGVKIGDSKSRMLEAYGDGYTNDVTLYSYISDNGKVQINFQIEDDIITGIDYTQAVK